eukprot:gene3634-14871_t
MFWKLFKGKKSRTHDDGKKLDTNKELEDDRQNAGKSSPITMPVTPSRSLTFSRMKGHSTSRASSIGHLSIASGMTVSSVGSTSSKASTSTVSSRKSTWSYDIDRFKGPSKLPKKIKGAGGHDIWAQAYTFGGR